MNERLKAKISKIFLDEKNKEIIHGSLYSFIAKILVYLLAIVTSIISARYYGAARIGEVAIIMSIMSISTLFAVFGFPTLLLRIIPKYIQQYSTNSSVKVYVKVITVVLVISSVVGITIYLFANTIASFIFSNEHLTIFIAFSSILIVISAVNSINISVIRALKKGKAYAYFEALPKIIGIILLIIFTYLFFNKNNLIYIAFITLLLITIISTLYLTNYFRKTNKTKENYILPTYLELLYQAIPMFMIGGLHLIISQTDTVMMGIFRTSDELGVYSIAFSLSMLTAFVLNSVNVISAPKFSELYHSNKLEELRYVAVKSSNIIFIGTLPIIIILIIGGKVILGFYSDEFISGYLALLFLTIGQFINSATGSVGYFLNMTGHQKKLQNILFISAILNIVLNYLLIPIYGLYGAAFATMTSTIFWNITAAVYIKKIFGFYISNVFAAFLFTKS